MPSSARAEALRAEAREADESRGRALVAPATATEEVAMSVMDVSSRIAQLQAQLALLRPDGGHGRPGSPSALDRATATALGHLGRRRVDGRRPGRREAKKYLGLPYVWGGSDPSQGMDCSGLVQVVYKKFGIDLPRLSADQARAGHAGGQPGRGQAR